MKASLIRGLDVVEHRVLLEAMFLARKRVFHDCLRRDVHVNEHGWEIDEHDRDEALYLILSEDDNDHVASLRLLPSTGKTELGAAFSSIMDGATIESAVLWECTRLVIDIAPGNAGPAAIDIVTRRLLLSLWETAHRAGIRLIIGAFDAPTVAALTRAGHGPELIGQSGEQRTAVYLGYWEIDAAEADGTRAEGNLRDRAFDMEMCAKAATLIQP